MALLVKLSKLLFIVSVKYAVIIYTHCKFAFDRPVSEELDPVRAKKQVRPPVVLAKQEVQRVIMQIQGVHFTSINQYYDEKESDRRHFT